MLYVLSIFGVLVIGYGAFMVALNMRRSRIKSSRAKVTSDSFAREFEGIYSSEAIKTAYADLTELSGIPVCRADDLEKTLGLLPEDFERMFEKRCRALGVTNVWETPYAKLLPLKTADDYVRFLEVVIGRSNGANR